MYASSLPTAGVCGAGGLVCVLAAYLLLVYALKYSFLFIASIPGLVSYGNGVHFVS